MEKPKFVGKIKKGEIRNPKGNPHIRNITKTGPRTDEGKLKLLTSSGNVRPWTKSKLINKFRKCNRCPMRARTEERHIQGKNVEIPIPASCKSYKEGSKCLVPQGDFLNKLELWYKIGEQQSALELQKNLTYAMLENAELAKEAEMMKNRCPGFYTGRFQELASKNLEAVNRLDVGELHKNVNVNISVSDSIIQAYNKRKERKEKKEKKESGQHE